MKRALMLSLSLMAACDWDAAETTARCTRNGGCDGGLDAGLDAGPADASVADAGGVDGGAPFDGGFGDAGSLDAGTLDGGPLDGGPPDGGTPDGGAPDAGTLDGGAPDSGAPDGGAPDGGPPDGGPPDGGAPDAGVPDAGAPDAGTLDAGAPDAGAPDAGTCLFLSGFPAPTPFRARSDALLSTTGVPFGVAVDGETVWSVVKTAAGGTEVFDLCRPAYSTGGAPYALHSNPDAVRGLLLGLENEVNMLTRANGVSGSIVGRASLVALARDQDGGARALIWKSNGPNYSQIIAPAPSLAMPTRPLERTCSRLSFYDVDVLEADAGGTVALSLNAFLCATGAGDVTEGLLDGGDQVQLISPSSSRTGFTLDPPYRTMVGRSSTGFDFAYQGNDRYAGASRRLADGGFTYAGFSSDAAVQLGDVMGGYLSGIALGSLDGQFGRFVHYPVESAFIGRIGPGEGIATVGPSRLDGGRPSHALSPSGELYVLWRPADGGVVLTTFFP
jgi:hypothetical protein